MTEYVRIKDLETGHKLTVSREQHEALGGTVVDEPALDHIGRPLAPRYRIKYRPSASAAATSTEREV